MDSGFLFLQEVLTIIGIVTSLPVAIVSYSGARKTGSASLLRLATSFTLLCLGFVFELFRFFPTVSFVATTSLVIGATLETTGYFFLAFSHAVDVMFARKFGYMVFILPVLVLSPLQIVNVMSFLSFYFVLYGAVETFYSYRQNKRSDTLLVFFALLCIALGTFLQWLAVVNPFVNIISLIQIIIREIGLVSLVVPVLNYISGRG